MLKEVKYKGRIYRLIFTQHALERMDERRIKKSEVFEIIEKGKSKKKAREGKWWVYKKMKKRNDNYVCLSVSLEDPNLIIITALVNWSPEL